MGFQLPLLLLGLIQLSSVVLASVSIPGEFFFSSSFVGIKLNDVLEMCREMQRRFGGTGQVRRVLR